MNHLQLLANINEMSVTELTILIDRLQQDAPLRQEAFRRAAALKKQHYGNKIYLRGLIEISNYCQRSCRYCGIQASNQNVSRYRLTNRQILDCCQRGYDLGFRTFVLQGGEDAAFSDRRLTELLKAIKRQFRDCAVTLSLGERHADSYQTLFAAGADRYLLRHETANPTLYRNLHPEMSFLERRRCLFQLRQLGYQTGAGFLVGLPDQCAADYAADLVFLRSLQPAMVGIGPFVPHPETDLANQSPGDVKIVLIMLALTRLLLPKVLLPATTALATIDPASRKIALQLGANVMMPNLTPQAEKLKYEIYRDKIAADNNAAETLSELTRLAAALNMTIDMGRGDHADWS